MTSQRFRAYLSLERAMLDLDELEDELADRLRDAMDPIWYALTDEERRFLNGRNIDEYEESMPVAASSVLIVQTLGVETAPGLAPVKLDMVPGTSWAA